MNDTSTKDVHSDLFGETLSEIADGPMIGSKAALTKAIMLRLSEKGVGISGCSSPKIMNRSVRTLQAYAREHQIAMPDYVPMSMRPMLVFMQRGDFFELIGEDVGIEAAAKVLNVAVQTDKTHGPTFNIPVHGMDAARKALKAAWFRVRLVKQKKGRKNG